MPKNVAGIWETLSKAFEKSMAALAPYLEVLSAAEPAAGLSNDTDEGCGVSGAGLTAAAGWARTLMRGRPARRKSAMLLGLARVARVPAEPAALSLRASRGGDLGAPDGWTKR